MRLTFVHQILISSGIGLAALFAVRSVVVGIRDREVGTLVLGIASGALCAALFFYLRKFRRKLAEQEGKARETREKKRAS